MVMVKVENKRTYRGPGVYIGRPSVLGNPFQIGPDGNRSQVIAKYAAYGAGLMRSNTPYKREVLHLSEVYQKKQGLTLICWCAPLACHGDVLARWIEALARGANPFA